LDVHGIFVFFILLLSLVLISWSNFTQKHTFYLSRSRVAEGCFFKEFFFEKAQN